LGVVADPAGAGLEHVYASLARTVYTVLPLAAVALALLCVHGLTRPLLAGVALWVVLLSGLFVVPLVSVHCAMLRKKRLVMAEVAGALMRLCDDVRVLAREQGGCALRVPDDLAQTMHALYAVYDRIARAPTWPVGAGRLSRFISVSLGPALLSLVRPFVHSIV